MKQLFILLGILLSVNAFSNLKEALIIDVRSEAKWNQGHLLKAQRVDWDKISNEIAKIAPEKNKKIILYCRSGNRAGKAMKVLASMGYTDLTNAGGLESAQELLNDKVVTN